MNTSSYRLSLSPHRTPKVRVTTEALERSLRLQEDQRKLKNSVFWGLFNAGLLAFISHEIMFTCPIKRVSFILYAEYFLALILIFNILYYVIRFIVITVKSEAISTISSSPIQHSPRQNLLLHQSTPNNTFLNMSSTPHNTTAISWRSNFSTFSTLGTSVSPGSHSYAGSTPQYVHHYSTGSSPPNLSYQDASKADSISEEHCLAEYLKGYEVFDKSTHVNEPTTQQANTGNSFWTYPAGVAKDLSNMFRNCQFQLSPVTSASSSSSPGTQSDDTSTALNNSMLGMEIWRRLNVDTKTLTKWNANLRTWLFQTIVERLVKEIDHIDDLLQKHGLGSVKVGCVGIERLRKTAEMATILQSIPTLSILLPFLEVCSNQEYLIKRLRDLAKGACLSDFKWNSGGSFHGKEWNESLPTDSEIIMHLFAIYMDTQLLPNPSSPDVKPFTGYHYIKYGEKIPVLTPTSLAIHQSVEKPPQYRVIVGEEIFEVIKGYNNLFHSILLFLYHASDKQHGMLGRTNLGRAGVNILWVIENDYTHYSN